MAKGKPMYRIMSYTPKGAQVSVPVMTVLEDLGFPKFLHRRLTQITWMSTEAPPVEQWKVCQCGKYALIFKKKKRTLQTTSL